VLRVNGGIDQPWVALDDSDWLFEAHRDRVVACSTMHGFDTDADRELRLHFERANLGRGTA